MKNDGNQGSLGLFRKNPENLPPVRRINWGNWI